MFVPQDEYGLKTQNGYLIDIESKCFFKITKKIPKYAILAHCAIAILIKCKLYYGLDIFPFMSSGHVDDSMSIMGNLIKIIYMKANVGNTKFLSFELVTRTFFRVLVIYCIGYELCDLNE